MKIRDYSIAVTLSITIIGVPALAGYFIGERYGFEQGAIQERKLINFSQRKEIESLQKAINKNKKLLKEKEVKIIELQRQHTMKECQVNMVRFLSKIEKTKKKGGLHGNK